MRKLSIFYHYFCGEKTKNRVIKTLKRTIRWIVGIVLGVYIGAIVLLNIDYVQQAISASIAKELSEVLQTHVTIGKINMGLLDRIIIDDVLIDDQMGEEMLKVTRLAVKFNVLPLFKGKISVSSIQLFGFNISFTKEKPDTPPNFQFIVDALASNDTIEQKKSLDLSINSILIRRGKISYHVLSEEETPGKFNGNHLQLQNIIANLSLKALAQDSVNLGIKRLSFDEQSSGFSLKKLSMRMMANDRQATIDNFAIELPQTLFEMDTIRLTYDNLQAFDHFTEQVHFSFRTHPSRVTLRDVSAFIPLLSDFKESVTLEVAVEGTIDQLTCSRLEITAEERQFRFMGDVSLQDLSKSQDTYVYGTLSELSANRNAMEFLCRNMQTDYDGIPPVLERMNNISFKGDIAGYFTDLVTYGQLNTDLGSAKIDLKLSADKFRQTFTYSGAVETENFELGKLLGNGKMGEITFNLDVLGRHTAKQSPTVELKGLVTSIEYSDYKYENITLDGEYRDGGFNGQVLLDDPNGFIFLNGDFNVDSKTPVFNFYATIEDVRPYDLNLTPDSSYTDAKFSLKIKANFTGGTIDDMIGEINVDSLTFTSPDKDYFMENITIRSLRQDSINRLNISSEFLTANIEGDFRYRTLPISFMNLLHRYIPSVVPLPQKAADTQNNFQLDVQISNTDILPAIFGIPLTVYTPSVIKGYFNETLQRFHVEGYFPRFLYNDYYVESGMVVCENPSDQIHVQARLTNMKREGAINLSLDVQAKEDNVNTTLSWGNNATATYSGKIASVVKFMRTEEEKPLLKAVVDIHPTDVILNDTLWQIHPSQIRIDSGKVDIDNFYFSHQNRHVRVNGRMSEEPTDTVKIDLEEINLGYVFDIADVSDDVHFGGDATGIAYASGVLKTSIMETRLFVKNFTLNQGRLGDLDISGRWDNEQRGIWIDGFITDIAPTPSHVNGIIQPLKPESGLDLNIEGNGLNIKFIEPYMGSIANDLQGRVTGNVHLYGKFKGLNLDGKVMTDALMKFDVLGTRFAIKDTIYMAPTGLTFDNASIADVEGHSGTMNGYVHFQHFKNLNYRFEIQTNNMLVMNTKESVDTPFYGTVYATGNALISGNPIQGTEIDVAMTTDRNTVFTYINGSVASATSNQFIKFVDKTPRRAIQDSVRVTSYFEQLQQKRQEEEEERVRDIRMNLLVDATSDATMRIVMDPVAGDYISGRGTGNIRTEYYNKSDDIRMFGTYQINQGVYKFSLQEVIRKDFIIKDGSSIFFNGNPKDANLDIQATYTVNSASLNDLIPDASSITQQPNVRVNCIMNLSGELIRPTIKLDIELPNEKDEIQTLVRNYISTEEQMNMQILYLLGIGKFYTEDVQNSNQNSNVMSSVLSSTLSGQLNDALSQVFNTSNWNIGTNLSTGDKGWTDMEIEGILSGQLLNNRLIFNGNFGYRDNATTNTNFVGDFEAEWLINHSGDVRLKAYNETNDRYYTKTNLTTQGVGVILKKDFDKWNELLFWNHWKLRNKRKQEKTYQQANSDSIPSK